MTNSLIPPNNVYSQIVAPHGLHPVLQCVIRLVGEGQASTYKSQFNGAETLHFSTDVLDFESIPLEDGSRHLLNGGVSGTLDDVVGFVRAMSKLFIEAGIEHRFEFTIMTGTSFRKFQNEHVIGTGQA
jgi:hypothetical protein